ncbi:MAG: hypothetical protein ABII07_02530 [Patescibacteria group bacterium]|nr:hypothetical protein [Patescibacteria group bacterium]
MANVAEKDDAQERAGKYYGPETAQKLVSQPEAQKGFLSGIEEETRGDWSEILLSKIDPETWEIILTKFKMEHLEPLAYQPFTFEQVKMILNRRSEFDCFDKRDLEIYHRLLHMFIPRYGNAFDDKFAQGLLNDRRIDFRVRFALKARMHGLRGEGEGFDNENFPWMEQEMATSQIEYVRGQVSAALKFLQTALPKAENHLADAHKDAQSLGDKAPGTSLKLGEMIATLRKFDSEITDGFSEVLAQISKLQAEDK